MAPNVDTRRVLTPTGPRTLRADQITSWARESYFEHADAHRCTTCDTVHRMDGGDVCDCDGALVPSYDDGTVCPDTLDACVSWLEAHAEAIFEGADDARRSEAA